MTVVFSFFEFAALYAETRFVALPLTMLPLLAATEPVPSPLSSLATFASAGILQTLRSATTWALARESRLYLGRSR